MNNIISAVGRRKSAIAQIKFMPGAGEILINNKTVIDYFQENPVLIKNIQAPLDILNLPQTYRIEIQVQGGGISGQADAIQLGIARGLLLINNKYRTILKPKNFLTRDSRVKERRKYGLKKARKAPQFSKR